MHVEYAITPRSRVNTSPFYNEDLCGHLGNTFWVLDGASSPDRLLNGGAVPDAQWLVRCLDALLRTNLTKTPELGLADLLIRCEESMHDQVLAGCVGIDPARAYQLVPHTTVVLLRIHGQHAEYLLLQDSSLLVFDGLAIREIKDRRQDELNATFYAEQDAALATGNGFSGPVFNASLYRMVDAERLVRNQPGGFWTFTGLRGAAAEAVCGRVELHAGSAFVLASDGAARYWEALGLPPQDAFTQPLDELLRQVRKAESADPYGQGYPRTSIHDDMALLRVRPMSPAPSLGCVDRHEAKVDHSSSLSPA